MNVAIIHRNPATAHGLALILEKYSDLRVVSEISDFEESWASVGDSDPGLVLIDSELPDLDVDVIFDRVKALLPNAAIAVLTGSDDWSHLNASIRAGAASFVSMKTDPEQLALCLRLVSDGHVLVSSPLVTTLSDLVREETGDRVTDADHDLSDRELEVLGHVANGATNLEIAEALTISENTVKVHMRNILGKLQLRNRQQAATYAFRNGLVSDSGFLEKEAGETLDYGGY